MESKMYLWDVRLTEKGYIKNFWKKEVDRNFIKDHPWIPRVAYDRNSVAGWESNYMNPEYTVQFFCNDTDAEVIFPAAWGMWADANRYGMEIEAMRLYIQEMETNPNAARFLRTQAVSRWDWLNDVENLENDIANWEIMVAIAREKHGERVT
jgi:hypothetical protein